MRSVPCVRTVWCVVCHVSCAERAWYLSQSVGQEMGAAVRVCASFAVAVPFLRREVVTLRAGGAECNPSADVPAGKSERTARGARAKRCKQGCNGKCRERMAWRGDTTRTLSRRLGSSFSRASLRGTGCGRSAFALSAWQ